MFFNEKVKDTSSSIIQFLLREKVEILSNLISENSKHLDIIDVFYQSNSPSAIFVGTFQAHHSQSSRGALKSILFRLFLHPPLSFCWTRVLSLCKQSAFYHVHYTQEAKCR